MFVEPLRTAVSGRTPRTFRWVLSCVIVVGSGMFASMGGNLTSPVTPVHPKTEVQSSDVEVVPHPLRGTLVICGGGPLPQPIRDRFCALAGGPQARIVIIPTAATRAETPSFLAEEIEEWKTSGATSVQLLHTRSRATANEPAFVRPLKEATGVWLMGGDQTFLTDAYLGTEVEKQLKSLLARGGVIGGTSAGAAVMSGVMIAGGRTQAVVRQGFDFFSGAVIDQHFLRRNRVERLLGVLSAHPHLVGLGIDEQTALVVDIREHHMSVIGDSYVVACVADSQNRSVRLKFLKSGDQTDLAALKVPGAAAAPVLGLGSL